MIWKNKEYKTYPEIIDCALSLEGQEQQDFVRAYAATGPNALHNVGYFAGYYDRKKYEQILKVFGTQHPVFGATYPGGE